jgi:hypothetical protein
VDHEHWFDRLNKVLLEPTSRRSLLAAATALVTNLGLGNVPVAEAAKGGKGGKGKGKRKGRGKGKGKGKGNPKPAPPLPPDASTCSRGVCQQHWNDTVEIGHCEDICEVCDGNALKEFCISQPDPEGLKLAVCCQENAVCCGGHGGVCCGGDRQHPGLKCCDGQCVDTKTDARHCTQCGYACSAGGECCNGTCCDAGEKCFKGAPVGTTDWCCPADYISPVCLHMRLPNDPNPPLPCIPDRNYVVCMGYGYSPPDDAPPAAYFCCGVGSQGRVIKNGEMTECPAGALYQPCIYWKQT